MLELKSLFVITLSSLQINFKELSNNEKDSLHKIIQILEPFLFDNGRIKFGKICYYFQKSINCEVVTYFHQYLV